MTKIVLVGYPGSQKIVPASKYLTSKYLPGFQIIYVNHSGHINDWSKFVAQILGRIPDQKIILALDDYLISGEIDMTLFKKANDALGGALINAKLCKCSAQEQEEYPCTTQYTIWNREFLIEILGYVSTPWEFEIHGSNLLKQINAQTIVINCIPYDVHSCLSAKWEGVKLDGLKEEDINYMKENGIL
jgi:ABC-type cobalt transport system substrate-binding protein